MMAAAIEPTGRPFGEALLELLREFDYTTSFGNPNLHAFSAEVAGYNYETLRKAVHGERFITPELIEEVAKTLRIDPSHFIEYRLHQARSVFDPREVGLEQAALNLEAWAKVRGAKKRRRA